MVPMGRADWIEGAMHKDLINPEENFRSKWQDFGIQYLAHAGHGAATTVAGGIDFGHRMFNKAYTKIFDDDMPPDGVPWPKAQEAWYEGMKDHIDNYFDRASQWAQIGVGTTNYILGTRPSQTWLNSFAGGAGDFTAKLPYYMALGEGLSAIGGRALGAAAYGSRYMEVMAPGAIDRAVGRTVGGVLEYGTNLTRALGTTRTGQLVGSGLKAYSEGYTAAAIEGQNAQERNAAGIDWAVQNTLFSLVGLNAGDLIQRYKLDEAAKSWASKIIRQGGKALGYTLFENAIRRAFDNHLNVDILPEGWVGPGGGRHEDYIVPGTESGSVREVAARARREFPDTTVTGAIPTEPGAAQNPALGYHEYLRDGIQWQGHPAGSYAHEVDPTFDDKFARSAFPVRYHYSKGLRIESRFISVSEPLYVRALDSKGNVLTRVHVKPIGGNMAETSWPYMEPPLRGRGVATEVYRQMPSILKSYGFDGWRSDSVRLEGGQNLWDRLHREGIAEFQRAPWAVGPAGSTREGYFTVDINKHIRNQHDVHGGFPHTGPDNQFEWRPLRREEIGEQHFRRTSASTMDIDPTTGEHTFTPGEGPLEEMEGGRNIYDAPHPEMPNAGHIVYSGQYLRYRNMGEMRLQYGRAVRMAEADIARYDPVRDSMGRAAEQQLYHLADRAFGRRDIRNFTPDMLHYLYARYAQWLNEVAEQMPKYHPEEMLKEAQGQVQAQAQADPQYAANVQRAKALGVDTAQALAEHRIKQNVEQTRESGTNVLHRLWSRVTRGTGSESSAIAKGLDEGYEGLPAPVFSATGESEYEPPEGASITYGALNNDIRRFMNTRRVQNIETVRKARVNGRRFLTDIDAREARLQSNRLASDMSLVGRRDPRTYNQRLSDETTDDFVKTLERSLLLDPEAHPNASGVVFEKPVSRFLFHWGDRANLPKPLVEKLAREIRKVTDSPNLTMRQMDRAADMVAKELMGLAKIDEIKDDGCIHIYGSNQYFAPQSVWQLDLVNKVNDFEMQFAETILANHPEAKRDMQAIIQMLQPKRTESYNIEDWIKYNRAIDDAMRGVITPQTAKELRGIRATERAAAPAPTPASVPMTAQEPARSPRTRAARTRTQTPRQWPGGASSVRGPDFEREGIYHVTMGDTTRRIYRDISGTLTQWRDADIHDVTRSYLGTTMNEAIAHIVAEHANPTVPQ